MFKNYLKIAFRNLMKYKAYSFINILGLAIGMACCILILLYVRDELSYDRFHENSDRIFRVTREWFNQDGTSSLHLGHVAPPIAPLMKIDFPDIERVARLTGGGTTLVGYQSKYFEEPGFFFADAEIFDVFTLPFVKGDPKTALSDPNSVVITEEMAAKYFRDEDPLNQVINVDGEADLKVTGVIKNIPHNSHFHFDFLGAMKLLENFYGAEAFQNWGSNNYATYLLLPENYDIAQIEGQFPAFLDRHLTAAYERDTGAPPTVKPSISNKLHLWPLTDIHLHSHLDSEIEPNGDIKNVYIFSSVAFFILLIACINFMNLATARSANRAKEVGLRKVVGADRQRLIQQFLGESVILSVVSLLLAILMVELALPVFSNFTGKMLELGLTQNLPMAAVLVGIALFVGILAGSYPAFFLSRFQPAFVLKGVKGSARSAHSSLRKGLVIFQFAISIILIISVGVVNNQLEFCRTKNLGLNKEHLVILPASDEMVQRYPAFKNRLLQHPNITGVAASKRVPSARLLDSSGARIIDGEKSEPINFRIANVRVDHDFIDTYGMEIIAGRNFSTEFSTDSTEAFILNETAVKKIGWASAADAIGKPFGYGSRNGKIIGVVKDFHYESLHVPITPVVLLIMPQNFNSISVRIRPERMEDITATLGFLENVWQEYRPNFPFTYSFLDDRYDQLYLSEHKLGQIFSAFSALAIFIGCLGLFGLASYTAEQRTKEIGIRKVMGASVSNLVLLLSKDFTKLVAVATLVSWPLAYFAMTSWLQDFAYRININSQLLTFFMAAGLALGIALVTVSYQAIKAALINPVNSLRYE
jgi:putative ABC transport system permease protein